jgi:hypothetical protein
MGNCWRQGRQGEEMASPGNLSCVTLATEGLYQIRINYPIFGGDKAEGRRQTGDHTRTEEKNT